MSTHQAVAGFPKSHAFQLVERGLTKDQQFRLIEIAHETTNHEVRSCALELLQRELNPLMLAVAGGRSKCDYCGLPSGSCESCKSRAPLIPSGLASGQAPSAA